MAGQATMNPKSSTSLGEMLEGIGGLGSDVMTLASLQAKLAAEDLQEGSRRALPAVVASVGFAFTGFASTTLAFFGVAQWLSVERGMALWQGLLLVAGGGVLVTLLLAVLAWRGFRSSVATFRRSQEELERNIAWIGTVMMHSGRSGK